MNYEIRGPLKCYGIRGVPKGILTSNPTVYNPSNMQKNNLR